MRQILGALILGVLGPICFVSHARANETETSRFQIKVLPTVRPSFHEATLDGLIATLKIVSEQGCHQVDTMEIWSSRSDTLAEQIARAIGWVKHRSSRMSGSLECAGSPKVIRATVTASARFNEENRTQVDVFDGRTHELVKSYLVLGNKHQ